MSDLIYDLEKCAIAASQWFKGVNMGSPTWERLSSSQREAYTQQAVAVLNAAGVKPAIQSGDQAP